MVASGALLFVMTGGVAAWADADTPPAVEPGSVEPGGEFSISNDGCIGPLDEAGEPLGEPGLVTIAVDDEIYAVDAETDGTWTMTLEAPEAPGTYEVHAACDVYDGTFEYPAVQVEVLAVEEPPAVEDPPAVDEPVTGSIIDITRNGCEVTITTEVSAPGEYRVEVWDDGENIDTVGWTMSKGGTYPAVWTITAPAMEGAPGVGFVLYGADPFPLDSVDPWEYPAEVADACYEATLPAGEAPAGGAGTGDAAAGGAAANLDVLAETGAEGSSSLAGLGVAGLLASAGVALVLIRRGRFALGG